MDPTNPVTSALTSPIVKIVLTTTVWVLLLVLLPTTPFQQFIVGIGSLPYLKWLNWFMPIGRCLTVMSIWWTAIIAYYAILWILRQIGMIGGQ